ncbi:hypothetical protein SGFS_066560 [Streptomyces graminofaciens]|uniref:DUF6801 domain-containing protein n=1 Tax=Streptomyces graminofaciens TaxID=68212 RepID=A0ABM8HLQ6_9ACTN|nr:DUF6801 domain-containing protein [Streptomyces graminofaciens]BBC35362.1 hypothetical protein SGFS_066560 [Streptomyces graminofaciens]
MALAGSTGLFGAGSASADPAPRSLRYTCPFPLIGDQPMTASVVWNASDTHVVGKATPRMPIDTTAKVGADVTNTLRVVGARTVEGTADVHAVVAAPEGRIPVKVTLRVPRTAVPESGPLTVPANGTIPSLTFRRPGPAKIVVGAIDLHLTPRDGDGDETLAGKVDTSCDLNGGQDGVLASFTVVRPPTRPSPTASGTAKEPDESGTPGKSKPPGASRAPGTADPEASGSASGSASSSAAASASASTEVRAPSGSPSGTASASASLSGAPDVTSPDASATGGTDFAAPLRAIAAFLAVSAAAVGAGWWGRRRRRAEGRDD